MIGKTNSDVFEGVSSSEWSRGTLITLAVTLSLVSLGVILDKTLGDNVFAYALMYSSWIIGSVIGARSTFLSRFSSEMKNVIVVTVSVAAFLLFYYVLSFAQI